MNKNIIVFDIETQQAFDDVGGRNKLHQLSISVLGAYDYRTDKYEIYEEAELLKFIDRLQERPLLVGFNNKRFDTPVLQRYAPFDLNKLAQLDMLEEIHNTLGHRVSLDSLAKATLSAKKLGSGLDAIKYFREGKIKELKKYCLEDVRITKEIFEYGAKEKYLSFASRYGSEVRKVPVQWCFAHPDELSDAGKQQSLF